MCTKKNVIIFLNGKDNLKKITFLLLILITAIILLASCVSSPYYDPKISAKNRCLLELDDRLYTAKLDNGLWGTKQIIIAAGKQDLSFKYKSTERLNSSYAKEWTANVPLSYEFIAGHHYKIKPEVFTEGSERYVRLIVEDLGNNTSVFHDGVYTGIHATMEMHLGSGGLSYAMAGLGFGGEIIIHNGPVCFDLSLTGIGDFGVGPGGTIKDGGFEDSSPICSPFSVSCFGMGTLYIPFTSLSISAGYGYRAEVPVFASDYDNFKSPILRGELKYDFFGLYFEYYTDPQYLSLFGETPKRDFSIYKKWGVGIFSRMN